DRGKIFVAVVAQISEATFDVRFRKNFRTAGGAGDEAMTKLAASFCKLSRTDKALFLARVAHTATIYARVSYVPTPAHPERDYDRPDPIILRNVNNFVHRVVGYIMHVLKGTERRDDESMVQMIEQQFEEWGVPHDLPPLLPIANQQAS